MPADVFGSSPAGPVHRFVLGLPPGPVLHVLDLGATVHRLEVTCGDGVRRNVALGHATPEAYLDSTDYIGASVGRYANRIARGRFELDGRPVQTGVNDRGNQLHGGPDGFNRRLWHEVESTPTSLVLELVSEDGDQGFPGTLHVQAGFVVDGDTVQLTYSATTDAPTVVNLTSHAYLNLDGDGAGTVDDHTLQVRASRYTPVDADGIPLGDHADVAGTPFDLRTPRPLGPAVRDPDEQVVASGGIDHNFVLDEGGGAVAVAARLTSPRTGTVLELSTDQPGLQVYTGNMLDGTRRSATGRAYRQGDGIALEPQHFPDSPNHPAYPSTVLRPGETYRSRIGWRITTRD